MVAAEDCSEISPRIRVAVKEGGRLEGGAAVTANSNSWPATLVLRTTEKALVLHCGPESVSGVSMRLKILRIWVLVVAVPGTRLKTAMRGLTSMGSQIWP